MDLMTDFGLESAEKAPSYLCGREQVMSPPVPKHQFMILCGLSQQKKKPAAVERICDICDSQGQILAMSSG